MKLLSADQIRQWDQYTMQHEPISSIDLMERAAKASSKWILQNTLTDCYYIFCGKGNNGGDGLAIARLLKAAGQNCKVFIPESGAVGSEDYQANFAHLHQSKTVPITLMKNEDDFPPLPSDAIIVDALFGTGLSRKLEGIYGGLVDHLNSTGNAIISIDIPSGMYCDKSSAGTAVIKATHTLTFQCLKLAFLVPENAACFGHVHILDIDIHPDFLDTIETRFELINKSKCNSILKPRKAFSHKGNFGHALLIAGSYGKMGAAVLSAKACMRSGVGLLTCHVPKCGIDILQTTVPEAMCLNDDNERTVARVPQPTEKYSAIGIGPGIGTTDEVMGMLQNLLSQHNNSMVIDADALNVLSIKKELLRNLPENNILTPHPKEFARLFGEGLNDYEKIEVALQKAGELGVVIILKGHHSFIATPDGKGYFNITGNPGMATGGSGDVLTGLLTGLLAQGYPPGHAAITGVFLHGLAGDLAAGIYSMEAMTAGDIIDSLGEAFKAVME